MILVPLMMARDFAPKKMHSNMCQRVDHASRDVSESIESIVILALS